MYQDADVWTSSTKKARKPPVLAVPLPAKFVVPSLIEQTMAKVSGIERVRDVSH